VLIGAAAVAGVLVLAVASSDDGGGDDAEESAATTPPDEVDVAQESDVAVNALPDVVVDDVLQGNKVNLRNVAPAETPILLWMYAPH
jgi:hypothetical protein